MSFERLRVPVPQILGMCAGNARRQPKLFVFSLAIAVANVAAKLWRHFHPLPAGQTPNAVLEWGEKTAFLLLMFFFLVALSRASLTALQGREVSVKDAFATAAARWFPTLCLGLLYSAWDLGAAGLLLHRIVGDHLLSSAVWALAGTLVSVCVTVFVYLCLPTIAREGGTIFAVVKRTASVFRVCWRQRLQGSWALWAWMALPTMAGAALWLFVEHRAAHPGVDVPLLLALVAFTGISSLVTVCYLTLDQIFDSILYVAVTEGALPSAPASSGELPTFRAATR